MTEQFHPSLYLSCDYLSILGEKLNHVVKRVPKGLQNDIRNHARAADNRTQVYELSPYPIIVATNEAFWLIFSIMTMMSNGIMAVDFPHKGQVTPKMFLYHDVFMLNRKLCCSREILFRQADGSNVRKLLCWVQAGRACPNDNVRMFSPNVGQRRTGCVSIYCRLGAGKYPADNSTRYYVMQ